MSDNSVVKTSKANHGLLPCPFCGTDAELNTASNSPDWMIISCPNITCAVNPGIEGLYDELADVVAAWNKRPTIEELRREVANWRSASETNLATCKRLREQLKAHGNETCEPLTSIPARPYPGDEEAIRQYGKSFGCRCVARRSDDNHQDNCEFWQGVLAARKQWMDRNVVAWSCSEEAAGRKRCSQWCGRPQFCTASGTDRRRSEKASEPR